MGSHSPVIRAIGSPLKVSAPAMGIDSGRNATLNLCHQGEYTAGHGHAH